MPEHKSLETFLQQKIVLHIIRKILCRNGKFCLKDNQWIFTIVWCKNTQT